MGNEDIINCISEHDLLAVVDMRHHKMKDREASQREVKDVHYVAEVEAGEVGVSQYALERKSKE
jgi:hypothetical protein